MVTINFGALATFILATAYTPGPNNIASSSMGVLYGYRRTVPFILGIISSFSVMMVLCGIISNSLYTIFPSIEQVMRIVGASYILWLAYKTLKSSYQFSEESAPALGYANGVLLNLLNPKAWIYGLTIYTAFLASITDNLIYLIISALFLAGVAFTATSLWALAGAGIKQILRNPKYQRWVNIALAIVLVYSAIDLSGIVGLLQPLFAQ